MARHRLPDDQLKNPRKIRKSPMKGVQLDVPEPSKKELKRWKPLLDLCTVAVLTNDRVDNIAKKNKIRISYPNKEAIPKDFPRGFPKGNSSDTITLEYNAELVLRWLWERKLAPYNANMLYKQRMGILMGLTNLQKELDVEL